MPEFGYEPKLTQHDLRYFVRPIRGERPREYIKSRVIFVPRSNHSLIRQPEPRKTATGPLLRSLQHARLTCVFHRLFSDPSLHSE